MTCDGEKSPIPRGGGTEPSVPTYKSGETKWLCWSSGVEEKRNPGKVFATGTYWNKLLPPIRHRAKKHGRWKGERIFTGGLVETGVGTSTFLLKARKGYKTSENGGSGSP